MKFLIRRGRAILAGDMGDVVAALPPRLYALWGRLMGVFKLQHPQAELTVTFGRVGQLHFTCPGYEYRGVCKHVRKVRKTALADQG